MSKRDDAKELLTHYLTHRGEYGDRDEADTIVDLIIDAVEEKLERRFKMIEAHVGQMLDSKATQ